MSKFMVEFTDQAENELKEIISFLKLKTGEDVIRKALSLLNSVVKEMKRGGIPVIENEKLNLRIKITKI